MPKFENETWFTLSGYLHKSLGVFASFLLLSACGGGATGGSTDCSNPDPTVNEQPIAYVQRPAPLDNNNNLIENDIQDPAEFRPGFLPS